MYTTLKHYLRVRSCIWWCYKCSGSVYNAQMLLFIELFTVGVHFALHPYSNFRTHRSSRLFASEIIWCKLQPQTWYFWHDFITYFVYECFMIKKLFILFYFCNVYGFKCNRNNKTIFGINLKKNFIIFISSEKEIR